MDIAQKLAGAVRTVPDFPQSGIQFRDITPILADPFLLRQVVDVLAEPFLTDGVTKVVGIEARGFILGGMLAHRLGAGFVPVRKKGKLPYRTREEQYALEYGSDAIEMHVDAIAPHDRVLIHDDVIATGGTAAAAYRLAQHAGADIVGYAFLVELDALGGRSVLEDGLKINTVLHF